MMQYKFSIRLMKPSDWKAVLKIYEEGLATGNATFETKVPIWKEWNKRHLKKCRYVAEIDSKVAGWVAMLPVSSRRVYAGVAEVSIYISEKHRGEKIGTRLMEKLIEESEKSGIWTLQTSVFPENVKSIRLNRKFGFREVGYREKIGKMNGVWRDAILFERRSKKPVYGKIKK